MKHSLSKRLFIITLGILLALISFTLIFQIFLFEPFYENRKKQNLIDEINKFKSLYSYQLYDQNSVNNVLISLENKTNSKIAIYSTNGELLYFPNKYNRDINDDSKLLNSFLSTIFNNEDVLHSIVDSGNTQSEIFYKSETNTKIIGVVSPISINTANDSIVVAISSIQPITEATSVISEFYIYIFIGFIFISILLSSIYSNLISKPLINIDKVAKKMSKMDFSEKCKIERDDEIGNLAKTLNFLSSTLDDALKDLQRKNKQLEIDIENERKLEIMRKDFVDSVSHELKTPIGIIEGYAEGIKDGIVSDQDVLLYLETIIDEAKKMGVLVCNMLELSKLESGTQKPKLEIFNVNRLINKVVKKHSLDAAEKNLTINVNFTTEYSYILADRFQLEQVLTNLITNALKYTPKNNNINISLSEENNSVFKFSIINEGAYIDPEEIPKLFNKFYRMDKSRERSKNSTGLGLCVVKKLLDLHNFPFNLQNNNGVEFTFWMPKQEVAEEE